MKPISTDLTQEKIDAWLLKGIHSLFDYLGDRKLEIPMVNAIEEAIPEIEKVIYEIQIGHPHYLSNPEALLSRILPLLIRALALRVVHSSAPMSNANETSLHFLLERLHEKSVRHKGRFETGPQGGSHASI